MFLGSHSPVHADLWETQFFPVVNYVSPVPQDWAGQSQHLLVSKFCVPSILLCFTNLLNSYFMPGNVLGAKDGKTNKQTNKNRVMQTDSCLLFGR